jgi:hypothetical protein
MSCGRTQDKLDQLLEKCCPSGSVKNTVLYDEQFYQEFKQGTPYTYCKTCKEKGHPGKTIADHPAEASSGKPAKRHKTNWEPYQHCLGKITFNRDGVDYTGQVAIVHKRWALTTMHCTIGIAVTIEDWLGSWTRKGTVVNALYMVNKVDLASVKLDDGEDDFANMFSVYTEAPTYDQSIWVLGFERVVESVYFAVSQSTIRSLITCENEITMCTAQYYSYDGLCGGGVVVCDEDGDVKLVGLHCLSHDSTETVAPVKAASPHSKSPSTRSVQDSVNSIAAMLHGHTSFQMFSVITPAFRAQLT